MSTVKLKRSATASKIPLTTDLDLGEIAINTFDGKLFIKKNNGTESIVEIGAGGTGATNLTYTANTSAITVVSDTGTDAVVLEANTTVAGVVTTLAQSFSGVKTFSSNTIFSAGISANGSFGTAGQVLTSNATSTYWSTVSGAVVDTNTNFTSEATTLATVTKTQIASFPVASFRSGKLIVQAYDSVTGEVQISELLVAHNGTIASGTEYGVVFTGASSIVTYDVDISAGNVRLMATRTTANSTQYKISETLMVA